MDTDRFARNIKKANQRIAILSRRITEDASQQELVEEALSELETSVEELRVAEEELHQQNEELMVARNQLETERQRYLDLFEFAPDGYLVTTSEGVILEANRAASKMLGIAQRFLVGKPFINFIAEVERADFRSLLNQFGRSPKESPSEIEMRIYPRAGKDFYSGLTIAPVMDRQGKVTSIRWLVRDINDRKESEEKISRLNSELEERVRERTTQLEAANRLKDESLVSEQGARRDAETANQSKDEFLAMVSNELRTPLNAILGWTHILRAQPNNEAVKSQAAEIIERNAKSQAQIIDDIIQISRIVTGKFTLDKELVNPAEIIREAIDSVRPSADSKGIRLGVAVEAGITQMYCDPNRLQQIVWNLLVNAIKFTPPEGRVEVKLERAGDEAQITVSDNGQGIEPEFLPHIFERFRQGDSTIARRHGGLGLGLSIVRHLVEMHGGRVQATSEGKGNGTTLKVWLPLAEKSGRASEGAIDSDHTIWPSGDSQQPDLQGLWVLAIDDEADAQEMLALVLEQWGAKVTVAGSCQELMQVFENQPEGNLPDVLVADIAMPGEDGYDLIRKIRSLPPEQGGDMPAIALTAYAGEEDRAKVLSAGYQMHVAKPVSLFRLGALIRKIATSNGAGGKSQRP